MTECECENSAHDQVRLCICPHTPSGMRFTNAAGCPIHDPARHTYYSAGGGKTTVTVWTARGRFRLCQACREADHMPETEDGALQHLLDAHTLAQLSDSSTPVGLVLHRLRMDRPRPVGRRTTSTPPAPRRPRRGSRGSGRIGRLR